MISAKIRVSFLVDGFNLYHSLVQAESELRASTKWLDLRYWHRSLQPRFDVKSRPSNASLSCTSGVAVNCAQKKEVNDDRGYSESEIVVLDPAAH